MEGECDPLPPEQARLKLKKMQKLIQIGVEGPNGVR
jgi:hypothetical protein